MQITKSKKTKQDYIDNMQPGFLVAYTTTSGKIESGKISHIGVYMVSVRNFDNKVKYIFKRDILWVKTGKRWPKGIYEALRAGGKTCQN